MSEELDSKEIDSIRQMLAVFSKHNTWTGIQDFKGPVTFFGTSEFKNLTVNGVSITGAAVIPTQYTLFSPATAQSGTSQNAYGTPVELTASSSFESMYFTIGINSPTKNGQLALCVGAGNGTPAIEFGILNGTTRLFQFPLKIATGSRITLRHMNTADTNDVGITVRVTMLG